MGSVKKSFVKSGRLGKKSAAKKSAATKTTAGKVAKKSIRISVKAAARGAGKKATGKETIRKPHTPALGGDLGRSATHNDFYVAKKMLLTLRVDADVLSYFRQTGDGYQAKMNEWLRVAMLESESRAKDNLPEVPPFRGQSPELAESALFKAKKVQLSLRLDAAVVAFYKARGKGYQTVMNKHLRLAMLELMESERSAKEKG